MERSTKHGPIQDDQLKHETEPIERGAPQRAHVEEWREVEPVEQVPAGRPETIGPAEQDIELRTELARVLTRDDFPAAPEELAARLADAAGPAALIDRVAALPPGEQFSSAHEVMVALGINAPEQR